MALISVLNKTFRKLSSPFKIQELQFQVHTVENKSPSPFEKYSYNEKSEMWMYPYDYVSILVNVKTVLNKDCLSAFVPGDVLTCVEV